MISIKGYLKIFINNVSILSISVSFNNPRISTSIEPLLQSSTLYLQVLSMMHFIKAFLKYVICIFKDNALIENMLTENVTIRIE